MAILYEFASLSRTAEHKHLHELYLKAQELFGAAGAIRYHSCRLNSLYVPYNTYSSADHGAGFDEICSTSGGAYAPTSYCSSWHSMCTIRTASFPYTVYPYYQLPPAPPFGECSLPTCIYDPQPRLYAYRQYDTETGIPTGDGNWYLSIHAEYQELWEAYECTDPDVNYPAIDSGYNYNYFGYELGVPQWDDAGMALIEEFISSPTTLATVEEAIFKCTKHYRVKWKDLYCSEDDCLDITGPDTIDFSIKATNEFAISLLTTCPQDTYEEETMVRISYAGSTAKKDIDFIAPDYVIMEKGKNSVTFDLTLLQCLDETTIIRMSVQSVDTDSRLGITECGLKEVINIACSDWNPSMREGVNKCYVKSPPCMNTTAKTCSDFVPKDYVEWVEEVGCNGFTGYSPLTPATPDKMKGYNV